MDWAAFEAAMLKRRNQQTRLSELMEQLPNPSIQNREPLVIEALQILVDLQATPIPMLTTEPGVL